MFIVCGPGRCGSTPTAEWLAEIGVFMGDRFSAPDSSNPRGFFEDLSFKSPNDLALRGVLNETQWREMVSDAIRRRSEPWGFKDPRVCHFVGLYRALIPTAIWVRLRRRRADVVSSMVRWYGWPIEHAERLTDYREAALDAVETVDVAFDDVVSGAARNQLESLCQTNLSLSA